MGLCILYGIHGITRHSYYYSPFILVVSIAVVENKWIKISGAGPGGGGFKIVTLYIRGTYIYYILFYRPEKNRGK